MRSLTTKPEYIFLAGLTALLLGACSSPEPPAEEPQPQRTLRVATFNVQELGRDKLDRVDAEGRGQDPQLQSAAEIVQRLRPDVLLLNEIDFDDERANARLFVERYLQVGQGGQEPIDYPQIFFEPSNTGVPIGHDLNNDGDTDDPEDCYGFGKYPGQYAMALLSRLPIDAAGARTFHDFLWRDMPGHLMPNGEDGKPAWYDADEAAVLRLSSKSHWDVPIDVGGTILHVLASHPTPGVFDGDEDRNGRRNFDEIRLWADYLSGGETASYLVDDAGRAGGLDAEARFVVLGDLNADPVNDPAPYGVTAIGQLLGHPRVQDPEPTGAGGAHVERPYAGRKETLTATFGRADYVLPDAGFEILDSGIFWPAPDDPLRRLVDGPERASDHHLVWIDLALP